MRQKAVYGTHLMVAATLQSLNLIIYMGGHESKYMGAKGIDYALLVE